jgi:hypothetical protein
MSKQALKIEALLLSALVWVILLPIFGETTMTIFTARDTFRAADLMSGNFFWFGPELSGGGRSTGPFYYLLLALPTHFAGYLGNINLMLALFGLSCGLIWNFLRVYNYNLFTSAFFLIAYLFAGGSVRFLRMPWNPSYLHFFWTVIALLVLQIFEQPKPQSKWWLFCLAVGLVSQIHESTLFWFPISLLLFPAGKLIGKQVLLGAGIIVAPQLPYYFLYPANLTIEQTWKGFQTSIFAASNARPLDINIRREAEILWRLLNPGLIWMGLAGPILLYCDSRLRLLRKPFGAYPKDLHLKFLLLFVCSLILGSRTFIWDGPVPLLISIRHYSLCVLPDNAVLSKYI